MFFCVCVCARISVNFILVVHFQYDGADNSSVLPDTDHLPALLLPHNTIKTTTVYIVIISESFWCFCRGW